MKRTLTATATTVCAAALSAGLLAQSMQINGAGATFPNPIYSKWFSEYNKLHPKIEINYQSIGSGGGIKQLVGQTVFFGASDAPMTDEQLKSAPGPILHMPTVLGAVVPVYNVPGVNDLKFTGQVLADIYQGKVTKWDDPAIAKTNAGARLPATDITVVHRAEASGTTFIWVDFLSKVSADFKKNVGVNAAVSWPVGVGGKGNEGVSGLVTQTPGSIGYVELIYALQNDMKYGQVQNKEGKFITPSLESVSAAAEGALKDIPDDLCYSLTDGPGKESYPISGTVWAVAYSKLPAGKGQQVVDFLRWVTHEGQEYCADLHYARLPRGLVKRLENKLDEFEIGK
jgi:phosphate transport system substrate-binding protein